MEKIEKMIEDIIYFICVSAGLIMIHEIGHAYAAEYYKLNPKIKIDKKGVFVEMDKTTKKKRKNIAAAGVFTGFILLFSLTFTIGWYALLFVILYLWGVRSDLKQILY